MSVQLRGSKSAQGKWLVSLLGIIAGFLAAPASAQVPSPPVLEHVDSNGVDAINGSFNVTATDISIGPAG